MKKQEITDRIEDLANDMEAYVKDAKASCGKYKEAVDDVLEIIDHSIEGSRNAISNYDADEGCLRVEEEGHLRGLKYVREQLTGLLE